MAPIRMNRNLNVNGPQFINNRERMDASAYRAENLMVGSRNVEATNRLLVTERRKGRA